MGIIRKRLHKQGKRIFVINGKGGVGKDTLVNGYDKKCGCLNVSSITPILDIFDFSKSIIRKCGFRISEEKDLRKRKLLSSLKVAFDEYCDLTMHYLYLETNNFLSNTKVNTMFVHIREPINIQRYKDIIEHNLGIEVHTILVKRDDIENQIYGNNSDDNVSDYEYDVVFDNSKPIKESIRNFIVVINDVK